MTGDGREKDALFTLQEQKQERIFKQNSMRLEYRNVDKNSNVISGERSEEPESNTKIFCWIPCQARNDSQLILKPTLLVVIIYF